MTSTRLWRLEVVVDDVEPPTARSSGPFHVVGERLHQPGSSAL